MKKDDGINVGDFQMQLLRTVEEQSLYIIELDKKIAEQDKKLEALEKKVKSN